MRIFVQGFGRWVDLDRWPPPATTERWHLHGNGRLARSEPAPSDPDRFRYDPAEPTPGLGGPSLNWRTSGPRDQAVREQRPDVLTYTSDSLTRDLTVAGPLDAEIWFRSSAPSTDVFVRLCDVDGDGLSTNVSDGILRVLPGEGGARPRRDDPGAGVDVADGDHVRRRPSSPPPGSRAAPIASSPGIRAATNGWDRRPPWSSPIRPSSTIRATPRPSSCRSAPSELILVLGARAWTRRPSSFPTGQTFDDLSGDA